MWNPFNTKEEMTELIAELKKPVLDENKFKKIAQRVILKKAVQGAVIGTAVGAAVVIAKNVVTVNTEEETPEVEEEN